MARFRKALPQLGGGFFLTDGGIETTLIFLEGLDLPDFAAFHLLKRPEGEAALRKYFRTYATLAQRFGTGLILESATWRASADWGAKLGYTERALADANRQAIRLLEEVRNERTTGAKEIVILAEAGPWTKRIRGLRANASRKSHAELNDSTELDIGDPDELGMQHAALKRRLPQLNVMGGCCGTDHRHIERIAAECAPLFPKLTAS
jgi:S-methylmethionine-dependent homocysteine/selenocysteine methylase